MINNLPLLFRTWNLYPGDTKKEWKGAVQAVRAALAPADVASRRSEVEMIYSYFKLEYHKAWREWQTLLVTITHLSHLLC